MLGSGHLISGLDVATGTFALMVFSAGIAVFMLVVLARFVLHRAGSSLLGVLVVCGLMLVGGLSAYVLVDRFAVRERSPDRRALEARAAELTTRSLAPGSALSCLDAVASSVVEEACERPLFASAEAVAAAVAYVDARFSLLAASAALVDHDPSFRPAFERMLRALEADRYGLVAHVLVTRGCKGVDCPELRLLRDPTRVVANMKAHVFEASVGAHAMSWPANGTGAAVAAAPAAPSAMATSGVGTDLPVTSGGPGSASSPKFDFPSASSIPAVSIMNAEPGTPPAAEPKPAALPPKRPSAPVRRHNAREAAAPAAAPAHSPAPLPGPPPPSAAPPPPPTQIVPDEPPAAPTVHDVHTR